MKLDDITEEKILNLVNFLDSEESTKGKVNPKMAILYWRLRNRWEKLDKAEERLKPDIDRRKENYKWRILNEIKQWYEEMKNENWLSWHYVYEIVNIKNRTDGKTMQIWFRDTDINDKTKWRKSILIEEKENPEFFQEMLEKYRPHEEEPALKPF